MQNNSDAQNRIGYFYESGIGIELNLKNAFYWYQKSAENENKFAQYNLGRCYKDGIGVEKDEAKAFEWYEKSAKQDYSNAQNSLGVFYKNDRGVKKKYRKSNLLVSRISRKCNIIQAIVINTDQELKKMKLKHLNV